MSPAQGQPPEDSDDAFFVHCLNLFAVATTASWGCSAARDASEAAKGGDTMSLSIKSSAFAPGGTIPQKYTADGDDVSPPLEWNEPPAGTKCFALICDDPDAPVGTWVHWVLWGLPADNRSLAESVPTQPVLPNGAKQGQNDFKQMGYGGPSPPRGPAHRYVFKLYALDNVPDLKPGSTKVDLERVMNGHFLAHGELNGKYGR